MVKTEAEIEKEDKEMKTADATKKGLYAGTGAGLALFALVGLLPGSFIGGVIGMNIAGSLCGLPLTPSLLPRLIVAVSMLTGVALSGVVFVTGAAIVGWLAGTVIDALRVSNAMAIGNAHPVRIK